MSVKVIDQKHGKDWSLFHGDCCEAIQGIPDNSIGYSIFSPPFGVSMYVFSSSLRDMSNAASKEQFAEHFRFLVRELQRVTMPGRNVSVHCMNLPAMKQSDGYIGLKDFRGDIIRAFIDDEAADFDAAIARLEQRRWDAIANEETDRAIKLEDSILAMQEELRQYPPANGFIYHSEVVVRKDPVMAMQRTKAIGLLHKQVVKDSAMSRHGIPDCLLTFRKPGDNPEPIKGEIGYYAGADSVKRTGDRTRDSINVWQRYAEPVYTDVATDFQKILPTLDPEQLEVLNQAIALGTKNDRQDQWMDINMSNTLQYQSARDNNDERHISPLQLQVIERCLQLWSKPGDVVFTPFAGIGSELWQAIKMGRKAIGIELKESYYKAAIKNLTKAEDSKQETLFDLSSCA